MKTRNLANIVYRAWARYILGNVPMADEPMRALERAGQRPDGPIVVPVWAYVHGAAALTARSERGTTYPFNCPWDAGRSGFAYCTREDARAYFGWKPGAPITAKRRALIVAQLQADVDAFSDALNSGDDE